MLCVNRGSGVGSGSGCLRRRNIELTRQEGQLIGAFLDLLGHGFARAMARFHVDADEHRIRPGVDLLQARRKLEAVGRDDAVEPHLVESLPPHVVALMVRSCSDTPTQWPTLADWEPVLRELAGGQLMDEPRRDRSRRRRRRAMIAVALAVLAAISLAVVLLAPRWWATVTSEEGLCVGRTHLLS